MTKILGFTDLRPRELETPLEAADYDGTVISIDPQQPMLSRVITQLKRGFQQTGSEHPDVILVYNGSGLLGLLSIFFGWYYSVPVLIRVNGDILRQHREKVVEYWRRNQYGKMLLYLVQRKITEFTFSRAAGYLVVSRELERIVRAETGCAPSAVTVVHSPAPAVEADANDTSQPAISTDVEYLLVTVTNLNFSGKFQGVQEIIDVLGTHLPDNTGYVVAGDGIYHEQLEAYIEQTVDDASKRERIATPGFVDDVDSLYAAADVFVYLSYIDGYPNAVLEAQLAELPVVANEAHGMVEQIDDGTTGLLFDPSDENALWEAVRSLLDDPIRRRRLGSAARRQVRRHNAPEKRGTEMLHAIDQLIDEQPDRPDHPKVRH